MAKRIVGNKVMVTKEFGTPIYIAPLKGLRGVELTEKVEDAERWSEHDGDHKLNYHRIITGYKELQFETLN